MNGVHDESEVKFKKWKNLGLLHPFKNPTPAL